MKRLALVTALVLVTSACAADLGEGRTTAKVEDVPTPSAAPVQATATDVLDVTAPTVLRVDPARSQLGVIGAKITAHHPIAFPRYEGRIGLDGDTLSAIAFRADVGALTAEPAHLQEHLKKEDFLFVDRYPHATFRSEQITSGAEAADSTHTITGDLTIRGVTKRVTFPAKVEVDATEVRAATEFVIDRRDFGVVYPGKADDLVQDAVVVKVSFVAPRS
jgi:polyisoprenoid-binding protein YceI